MSLINHQVQLASRPDGEPSIANFRHVQSPVAALQDGQVLVRNHYLSLDPYMRGRMNDAKSYAQPQPLGEVMQGGTAGEVVESRSPKFAVGDKVVGMGVWQEYSVVDGNAVGALRKVDTTRVPLSHYLGAVGMPGVTAWYGLVKIIAPKEGDTVVVSAATGAVGSAFAALAKARGCRVVGIAGGPEKCAYTVGELGFDACIDYKAGQVKEGLRELCPKGVDVYFDNVGGDILDTVLTRITRGARIVICGAISQYNATGAVQGPKNYLSLLVNRARMEGIVVFDYADRYHLAVTEMAGYLKDGRMKSKEDVVQGLEKFPDALLKLFNGENFGKLVLQVTKD